MGYYTGILELPGCGRNWCGVNIPTAGDSFKWAALSNIGGVIGLTLFYLILNRRYVISTIKTAFTSSKEIDDSMEPISYRTAYILFIVSFVAVTLLYMGLGMSPGIAALMPIIAFVAWIASLRIFGLIGFNAVTYGGYGTGFVWLIWPVRPEPVTREWFWARLMNRTFLTDGFGYGWPGVMTASFAGYKMGELTKTSNKVIFKTLLLSSIIAPLVAVITYDLDLLHVRRVQVHSFL